jgi:hypothetical protein
MPSQAQGRHTETAHFASFVLRCWIDSSGQIRARLVDVHTGINHPLVDLDELPDLIRYLLAQALPDSE